LILLCILKWKDEGNILAESYFASRISLTFSFKLASLNCVKSA